MSHTMTFRVFSSATRLLAVLESFAGVPHRQVATLGGGVGRNGIILSFFFSQASTIMAEAITIIQARTNWIFSGVLHSQHIFFKEIE